ncbi:MAG: methanethiol S-methyltransferase [Planctomycetota bacterium]
MNTTALTTDRPNRLPGALYGVGCYVFFLVTFLYAVGFVADLIVPKTINGPATGVGTGVALLVNGLLMSIFALQHSVMARPAFKRWWTRYVPQSVERQTYVLATNVALWLLFAFWQPMPGVVWSVENPIGFWLLTGIGAVGWLTVLCATFMINHFDLFGLRQTWYHWKNQPTPALHFHERLLYRWVRHPIQMGFLIAFWGTAHMTVGHLLFAAACTAYIVVALQLEERDLVAQWGARYEEYRGRVRMLVPIRKNRR